MKIKVSSKLVRSGLVAVVLLGVVGCSTTDPAKTSTKAAPLRPKSGQQLDLGKYRTVSVAPFSTTSAKDTDASVGVRFSDNIALRLRSDFGGIFDDVRTGKPKGEAGELVVAGTIKKYNPGSKFGRAMLAGVGAAKFEGELVLTDATDNRILLTMPFDKLWAWGGFLGMSKDIDDMVTEAEASIANTIARAKGWSPPAK